MSPRTILMRILLSLALLPVVAAPVVATAQTNSRQAIEAARKHRAERGAEPRQSTATDTAPAATSRPYRSSADPKADPNLSLKSCLNHVGMNPVARDRCMRQHCEGRWGQGDCPVSGGNVLLSGPGATSNTPLGRCLREAGRNPFKRDACGWKHCNNQWETSAECAAIKPQSQPLAN